METFYGILIPFLGTSLGAACVFFMKKSLSDRVQRSLTGFAAGVMVAASVWSLLIPAIEQSAALGKLSFLPAAIGFWTGVLFLLLLDHTIPHLHRSSEQAEGPKSRLHRTTMMMLAVTLHNIPEGMAVGVVYAGYLSGSAQITAAGALALSLGIAIQNFPEGAIISMPLHADRFGRPAHCAGAAVPFELRRRSNAVRRRRGAYPRNVTGHALQHRHGVFCRGLYRHDDLRRCAWVNGVNAILNALLFSALTAPFHRAKS